MGGRVKRDARLRAELKFCNANGIPLSRFHSWDIDDRAATLAYQQYQGEACGGCGTRREEWQADRFAYTSVSYQCPGCELLEMERENVPEKARGVQTYLVPFGFDEDED